MDFKRINLKFPRFGDIVIVLFIIVASFAALYFKSHQPGIKVFEINVDGKVVVNGPLPHHEVFELEGAQGKVVVEAKGDTLQVISSSCPEQLCVKMGKITKPGEVIVCAPNKTMVSISSLSEEKEVDVIAR